jgi:hypothetical protein
VSFQVHIHGTKYVGYFSLLCFALLCLSFAAAAQQPSATAPPRAIGNEAGWEEASARLISSLTAYGHNYVVAWDPKEAYRISLEKDFDSPMRCDIGGKAFYFENVHGTAKAGIFTLDFTRIDPLSIQVGYDQALGVWAATMSGLRGMAIGSWTGVLRSHVAVADVKDTVKPDLLEPACSVHEKHCKPDDGHSTSADQLFNDQNAANEFAAAARRAATLCNTDPANHN